MSFRTLSVAPLALLAAACSSTSSSVTVEPEVTPYEMAMSEGCAYTMVVTRRGPTIDVMDPQEIGEVTSQHIEFTEGLSEANYLLVSGPFVGRRVDKDLRSLAIVDSTDRQTAYERMCADPATEAGALTLETFRFIASKDLRNMPSVQRTHRDTVGEGEMTLRPYVLVEGPTGEAFDAFLGDVEEIVLFHGDCMGGTFEGRTIAVLDCRTVTEADELMVGRSGLEDGAVHCHPWVSSVALSETN